MSEQEASAVPPQSKSSWSSFLKSLKSFNGDLSAMTAPPFILSSTSLTEYSSYWTEHPSIFVAPAKENDPAKRTMLVLKWFLSTLKQQYSGRNDTLGSEKKPLNPFLGELFLGKWEDDAGTTNLVSEQVSHHPPVTAYCVWNEDHGVRLQGYNGQKATFGARIDVRQVGHALLHIDKYDEYYLITLPALHIEGLFVGSPYVELNGKNFIQSSSGYTVKMDYSGKGWISGKKNTFNATVFPEGKEKEPIYIADGQWNASFEIKDANSKEVVEKFNHKDHPTTSLTVGPIENQDELESRAAWRKVADALAKGDMNKTSAEKSLIENSQRELRKKEQSEGKEWQRIFFNHADDHSDFDKLASKIKQDIESSQTNGVWKWDEEKAKNAKSPYRPGTMPKSDG